MNRVEKTFWHTAIYMAGIVASRGVPFLLLPLYTREGADPFARWDLCASTVLVLFPMINLGMSSAIVRFYYDSDRLEDRRRVFNTGLGFVVLLAIPITSLLFIFAEPLSFLVFREAGHAGLWRLVSAIAAMTALSQQPMSLLRAAQRSLAFASLNFCRAAVGPAVIVVLLYRGMGIAGILWGELAGLTMVTVAGLVVCRKWIRPGICLRQLKPMLAFGAPLLAAAVGTALLTVSDRYFLVNWVGETGMAPYSLGFKLGMILGILTQAVQLAWPPMALQLSTEEGGKIAQAQLIRILQVILFSTAMGLSCLVPDLIKPIAPAEEFGAARLILPWIAFSYALHGSVQILMAGLGIAKRTVWSSAIVLASGIFKLVLAIWLIRAYGIFGAAISTLAGFSLELLLTYIASQRFYPLPHDLKRYALLLGFSAMGLAGVLASFWLGPWTSALARIAVLITYLGLSFSVVLRQDERAMMGRGIREQYARLRAKAGNAA